MFKIIATTAQGYEEQIDEFETLEEAGEMLIEYAFAFGTDIPLRIEEGRQHGG